MTDMVAIEARREALMERFSGTAGEGGEGPLTGGVHHLVLIASDLEATIAFYTEVLGMGLNSIIQNRDDPTSTHVFLDMGGGNQLAFFDFPEHGSDPTVRGIGSMHHVAIKSGPEKFEKILARVKQKAIDHSRSSADGNSGSLYLRDPDNVLVEITSRE